MATLPADVLLLIFPHLKQRDQYECLTVCKAWCKVIRHHTLFRDIHIRNQKHLDKLIRQVIKDPTLGTRVERLTLNLELRKGFDEMLLIDLFPNVRQYRLINQDKTKVGEEVYEIHENHPWCDRIEKLVDTAPFNNTIALVKSGLCKNLTHLSLLGKNDFPRADEFFELLYTTPSLTTLELREFHVTCDDLELLHSVVSSIQSIDLYQCYFDCNPLPSDIEPATSVKRFRCFDTESDSFSGHDQYIRYIAEKYSHLEDLTLEIGAFDITQEEDQEPFARYTAIVKAYLTKLGTRLKSLSVYSGDFETDISVLFDLKMLDECGCKVEKLELRNTVFMSTLEELSRSNQAKYIQSLRIDKMHYDRGSRNNKISLQWLARFKKLKELSLDFPHRYHSKNDKKKHELNLPDLLNPLMETQVETLQIKDVELHVEVENEQLVYPAIKDLFLHEVEFQWHTDVYMAKLLPNIKRLTLDSCLKDRRLFTFPNLELSYFQISQVAVSEPLRILVITVDDGQQRLYTVVRKPIYIGFDKSVEAKDVFSLPPVTSAPYTGSSNLPFVTIVCKSLSELFILKSDWIS